MGNDNQLMDTGALNSGQDVTSDVDSQSPVKDSSKVREILEVKQLVLSNARILYGSEARKFFDFVTACDPNGKYICALVCSLDGRTRILRKETSTDALEAARTLAEGLIKDAGTLFTKAEVGDQLMGQQGYCEDDGKFKLDEYKPVHRFSGPIDDTKTLYPEYRGQASRSRPVENKRRRVEPDDSRLDY